MKKAKLLLFLMVLTLFITIPVFGDTLKTGSSGTLVNNLQTKLISMGYLKSKVTGYYGNQTKEAVKKFQAKNGLKVDGIAGTTTQKVLFNSRTSSLNSVVSRGVSSSLKEIQAALKSLGFYKGKVDGISGPMTKSAIKSFQKSRGLVADGIVGYKTQQALFNMEQKTVSRGSVDIKKTSGEKTLNVEVTYGELLDWWTEADSIFYRGAEAKVIDLWTGKSFSIMRTYGRNHADCETLTADDTKIMKEIWGDEWSWNRRPVIVITGEKRIAASMAGMPHAGLDNKPANVTVSGRSTGYGTGINLDTIKENNMDGHFDVHFLNSRTHATNKVDSAHQKMVKQAAGK